MRANLKEIKENGRDLEITFIVKNYDFHEIPEGELELKVEKRRDKRGIYANSYYQIIIKRLASELDMSRDEVNNIMLSRYGEYLTDESGEIIVALLPEDIDYLKLSFHVEPTPKVEDGKRYFRVLKGSSELNSREFAKLVDGALSEVRDLGIEI